MRHSIGTLCKIDLPMSSSELEEVAKE